jgi:hypothetical protein
VRFESSTVEIRSIVEGMQTQECVQLIDFTRVAVRSLARRKSDLDRSILPKHAAVETRRVCDNW